MQKIIDSSTALIVGGVFAYCGIYGLYKIHQKRPDIWYVLTPVCVVIVGFGAIGVYAGIRNLYKK